jgi:hypothetical protein
MHFKTCAEVLTQQILFSNLIINMNPTQPTSSNTHTEFDPNSAQARFMARAARTAISNSVMQTTRINTRKKSVANTYDPKQRQFTAWCVDPASGGYSNDIVTEEKMSRFILETLLVINATTGKIISERQ